MDSKVPSIAERLYEDFDPVANWVTEESKTIEIHLPDFRKEQIRVQLSDLGNLKISGERPLEGNKWSRFRLSFRLPKDCNFNEIHAKFINNILQIMLPKKTSRNSVSAAHPSTEQEVPTSEKIENDQVKKPEKPAGQGVSGVVEDSKKKIEMLSENAAQVLRGRRRYQVGIGEYVMKMSKPRRVLVVNVVVAITMAVAAGVYAVYKARSASSAKEEWYY
ncbi:hypothetical protein ACHQM5_019427 [Ranunculus cassubicifolius]